MASVDTKLSNLIDPEVMAPMIEETLTNAIVVTPFAKIDTTLVGQAGSTITVPKYEYIGDATDLAEGVAGESVVLSATSADYTVKKVSKDITLTDEVVNSAYGNPVGAANRQIGKAIASKIDNDAIAELLTGTNVYTHGDIISYDGVVSAIDKFEEEENTEKAMFINPVQVTQLRLDPKFIDKTMYGNEVMVTGEIGMIANTRIVASRKVAINSGVYACPIMKLNYESQTEDDTSAITIFMKQGVEIETERETSKRATLIAGTEHYVAALTDDSKVVVAKFTNVTPTVEA